MAHGIRNVSKFRPCPICGKTDWCGACPSPDVPGGEIILCMRDTAKRNTEGIDGNRYVYLRDSRQGNSLFELYEQNLACRGAARGFHEPPPAARQERPLTPVGIIEPAAPGYCATIYRFMQEHLSLDDRHHRYLQAAGWDDSLIARHCIVSFPEDDFIRARHRNRLKSRSMSRRYLADCIIKEFGSDSLIGIPGAYRKNGQWTFSGHSGILLPMYDFDGNMFRMRIRRDFLDVPQQLFLDRDTAYYYEGSCRYYISMKGVFTMDGQGNRCFIDSGGKYRTLSSFYQDKKAAGQGFFANSLECGCRSLNEASLYTGSGDNMGIWNFTEGEPKGIFTNAKLHAPVVTLPGVNSYGIALRPENIAKMKAAGMEMAVVLFDADKVHNEKVLSCEQALVAGLKEHGIPTAIGNWDEEQGKGCDDLLAAGGSITYSPA